MKRTITLFGAVALLFTASPITFASFSDVPASHLNYDAINYVQSKGVVEGYPDGTYQPDKLISRYEFTKIIIGATFSKADIDACVSSPFGDVPTGQWFTPYVCVAQKNGVVGGYPDGTFQGTNQINLVEASKIIVNGFKYPVGTDAVWYKPYILKLEELKALPTTLTGFNHQLTRGEMAEVIDRLMEKIVSKTSTTYANLELVTVAANASHDEISNKAAIYSNIILGNTAEAIQIYVDYLEAVQTTANQLNQESLNKLEANRLEAIKELTEISLKIKMILPFLADSTLKDAYLAAVDNVIGLMQNEYKKLNELLVKDLNGQTTQADIEEGESISGVINEKIQDKFQKTETALNAFGIKFDFTINKNLSEDPNALDALNYVNNIFYYQSKGKVPLNSYNELTDNTPPPGDYEMLEAERTKAVNETKQVIEEVASLEGYQGDFSLRDALIQFFNVGLSVLEYEHKELLNLRMKMDNEGPLSQADLDKVSELYDSANQKLSEANQAFDTAVTNFNNNHGL